MHMHPYLSSQLAAERQANLLAKAAQQHTARQARAARRSAAPAGSARQLPCLPRLPHGCASGSPPDGTAGSPALRAGGLKHDLALLTMRSCGHTTRIYSYASQWPGHREELAGSRDRNRYQGPSSGKSEPAASAGVGQRGHAQRRALARQDGPHRRVEAAGIRAADGAAAEHRRGRPGRPERPWRRAASRARLPDPVLPVLAAALRA